MGCLLISSESLGLETAENNLKPLPSTSSKLFSEDGTIYSDRLFFFFFFLPDVAILHMPTLRLAEETVDAVVTV